MASKLLLLPLVPALAFSIVEVARRPEPTRIVTERVPVRLVIDTPLATDWCGTKLEIDPPVSAIEPACPGCTLSF